jgi:hypothetical protein
VRVEKYILRFKVVASSKKERRMEAKKRKMEKTEGWQAHNVLQSQLKKMWMVGIMVRGALQFMLVAHESRTPDSMRTPPVTSLKLPRAPILLHSASPKPSH